MTSEEMSAFSANLDDPEKHTDTESGASYSAHQKLDRILSMESNDGRNLLFLRKVQDSKGRAWVMVETAMVKLDDFTQPGFLGKITQGRIIGGVYL